MRNLRCVHLFVAGIFCAGAALGGPHATAAPPTAGNQLAINIGGSGSGSSGGLGGIVGGITGLIPIQTGVTIDGTTVSVTLNLAGISVDLGIQFEQVSNLTVNNLGLGVRLASMSELSGRLPAGVTPALPLVIAIEPPKSGGLSFHGIAAINVHTHLLNYTVDTPLRLYSAPIGGSFTDITEMTGTGSYRACGSKGGFSEFIFVTDLRALDAVIGQKLDDVQALLTTYSSSIPDDVEATLQGQLDATRAAWIAHDYTTAAQGLEAFAATVKAHSGGSGIPDEWRAARDRTNVAGYLRAAAGTARYSLVLGE